MSTLHFGYVLTDEGEVLIQVPDENTQWGFYLTDGDQSWDGGVGVSEGWEALKRNDRRITEDERAKLEWVFDA